MGASVVAGSAVPRQRRAPSFPPGGRCTRFQCQVNVLGRAANKEPTPPPFRISGQWGQRRFSGATDPVRILRRRHGHAAGGRPPTAMGCWRSARGVGHPSRRFSGSGCQTCSRVHVRSFAPFRGTDGRSRIGAQRRVQTSFASFVRVVELHSTPGLGSVKIHDESK